VLPTLVRPAHRTLEIGWWNPQKGDRRLSRARPGQHRDVRPVSRVFSVTISPVRPYPLPRRHPRHCCAIPNPVGARDDKMPPRLLLCTLRPPVSRTLESAYGRRPNEKSPHSPLEAAPGREQDSPRRPAGTLFARTAINSTILCTIPLLVIRTVWHDCKLPPLGL
jgi:hypothetical protein